MKTKILLIHSNNFHWSANDNFKKVHNFSVFHKRKNVPCFTNIPFSGKYHRSVIIHYYVTEKKKFLTIQI